MLQGSLARAWASWSLGAWRPRRTGDLDVRAAGRTKDIAQPPELEALEALRKRAR